MSSYSTVKRYHMKIAELEKKVGISRDTLRYYEKIGVITPPMRADNGYRYYGKTQLSELAFIKRGKAIGFTLAEIKSGYEQYKMLGAFCPEFIKQLQEKKQMFNQRISEDRIAIDAIDKLLVQ